MAEHQEDDLLTEEEMAALKAEEGEEVDGSASLEEDMDEWAKSGWKDEGMAAAEDDEDDGANAEEEAAAEAAKEPEADPEPKPRDEAPRVSTSDLDKKLADLRSQDDDLLDQYDDGDLTREELATKRAELQQQADELVGQRAREVDRAEREMNEWKGSVASYLKDYPGLKEAKVIEAFDAEVRAVTSSRAYANLTYQQQLSVAHKRLTATADDLGLEVPAIKGAKKPAAKTDQEDLKGDDMRRVPPTLARVPASDVTGSDGGKYAALNKIVERGTPDEIEHALSQLSDEERDRFSSMNT